MGGGVFDTAQFNEIPFNAPVVSAPAVAPQCQITTPCGPTYGDMVAELMGTVPRLSALHAQQIINRSWLRVRDSRLWSFHFVSKAQLFVPDAITEGSVNVTFNSTRIQVDPVAAAALDAVALSNPPLACKILGVGRQIRIGSINNISAPTGPNYTIVAWDGFSTLTIDRPYGEFSATRASYQVFKCFYAPPPAPACLVDAPPDLVFVRYQVITNANSGYAIFGPNLYWNQAQLDAIDPQRGGQGDAYIVANYGRNCLGQPVIELYPNPVKFTTYLASYWTQWPTLKTPDQCLPRMPYELADLVIFGAKQLAADWALANVSTFPELGQTNWVAYRQTQMAEYRESKIQCFKQDDEMMPLLPFRQGQGFMFPLGGQFLQSHDVTSILPRGY